MLFKTVRPFLWVGVFVMLVGMACGLGGDGDPTPPPPTDAPAQPTDPPAPTLPPPPTSTPQPPPPTDPPATEVSAEPTEVPASNEPPAYYIEEFEGTLDNYTYFLTSGTDRGSDMLYLNNGALTFDLTTEDTWVYVTYDPWTYSDVWIGLSAENRGANNQNVSLICRESPDGWFEFNISGNGLYWILVYDALNSDYFNIFNGGSTQIGIGRVTNEYIVECIGNDLNLYINGELVKNVTVPSDYRFIDEGRVGFSVSSFDTLPILVNIEWFGIEAP